MRLPAASRSVSRTRRRIQNPVVWVLWLTTAAIGAPGLGIATESAPIEYWTIEPNEGESAGGHAAIRIGESIYHVEHRGDDLIADRRDHRIGFERAYRLRGNRAVSVLELALSPAVADELESILRRRYFDRRVRLDRLEVLEETRAFLDRAISLGRLEVEVPGLGLYEAGSGDCRAAGARPRRERKRTLLKRQPPHSFEQQIARTRREIRVAIRQAVGLSATDETVPGFPHSVQDTAIRRVVEAAQLLGALEVVRGCAPPSAPRLIEAPERGDATKVAVEQAEHELLLPAWLGAAGPMEDRFAALLQSERPDRGLALLLGWARLVAFDRSGETGRVTILDSLVDGAAVGDRDVADVPTRWQVEYEAAMRAALLRRLRFMNRAGLSGAGVESGIFRVETALHTWRHATSGNLHRSAAAPVHAVRVTTAARHPVRVVPLPWPEELTLSALERRRSALANRIEAAREGLRSDLGYALLQRNCVTELLSALDAALTVDASTASFHRLRRRDPEAVFAFIPVVAHRIVGRHIATVGARREPSWREARLVEARQAGGGEWRTRLRESNTLSSRLYPRNERDSAFLFFTQRPVWIRPILGLANLTTAIGATVIGVLSAPVDLVDARASAAAGLGVPLIERGLNGALMSIPELFFFNVRKGSYAIDPPVIADEAGMAPSLEDGT